MSNLKLNQARWDLHTDAREARVVFSKQVEGHVSILTEHKGCLSPQHDLKHGIKSGLHLKNQSKQNRDTNKHKSDVSKARMKTTNEVLDENNK
jgi:hypothetical protein